MPLKCADAIANSVDPNETAAAPLGESDGSDLRLHCLLRPVCPKIRISMVMKAVFTSANKIMSETFQKITFS